MQQVQIDIQDKAGEELGRILETRNARESALRIHIAGMG
jgi:Fe-S cluster assembly iron-binding protein IscA